MTKLRQRRAKNPPPRTVLSFRFPDGTAMTLPTGEALLHQFEHPTRLEAQAQVEYERQRASGAALGDAEVSRAQALVQAQTLRERNARQLQWLIDTAARYDRTTRTAGEHAAKAHAAAGVPTRQQFDVALAAAREVARTSGQALTASTILDCWPTPSRPGVRRVQQLLEADRKRPRPSNE